MKERKGSNGPRIGGRTGVAKRTTKFDPGPNIL